jgi:hypothetical protein
MSEILSFGNPILQAWRVELDFHRWKTLLDESTGSIPHALFHLAKEAQAGLTSFIAELRVDQDHQLLRPYQYELAEMDLAVANRETETREINGAHRRATATEIGISKTHDHFRSHDPGAQAVLMSPVNETTGRPEYLHTAIYFLTHENGVVAGWQLFVDFSQAERLNYMSRVARRAGADYWAQTDLDLAVNPILSAGSAPLYSSIEEFIADVAGFLKTIRDRVAISGISLENPQQFIVDQMRLEAKNRHEAENWVEPDVRAIAAGSIDLAGRIITKLQLKTLNLTESAVRAAARLAAVDVSALQVFLRACGFLSFSFSPETSVISPQSFLAAPITGGHCQEKICSRCGTHAGDHDTKCPSCGWSP